MKGWDYDKTHTTSGLSALTEQSPLPLLCNETMSTCGCLVGRIHCFSDHPSHLGYPFNIFNIPFWLGREYVRVRVFLFSHRIKPQSCPFCWFLIKLTSVTYRNSVCFVVYIADTQPSCHQTVISDPKLVMFASFSASGSVSLLAHVTSCNCCCPVQDADVSMVAVVLQCSHGCWLPIFLWFKSNWTIFSTCKLLCNSLCNCNFPAIFCFKWFKTLIKRCEACQRWLKSLVSPCQF